MAGGKKKGEAATTSPPGLRPRKNCLPSTSTPVAEGSRKRKPSAPSNQGKVAKKRNDSLDKMMRSPADKKSAAKSKKPGKEKHGDDQDTPPLMSEFENSGTLDLSADLLLGDSNVLADTNISQAALPDEPAEATAKAGPSQAAVDVPTDPFAKLHMVMEMNFASIRSDNQTMSGQLGMLQSNVASLRTDFDGLNSRLTNVTAQAVANKCGISNINKQIKDMQNKQQERIDARVAETVALEMEKAGAAAGVPGEVSQRLDKLDKELDRMRALQTVQQMSSRPGNINPRRVSAVEDESAQYWAARKKLRCSPIDAGKSNDEMLKNTYAFLQNVLDMPADELPDDCITGVKKVPGRKRDDTKKEVVITFVSVQMRDCVASYAPNLADWRGKTAARASLRLEIPDYLCGVFRVLERHAHQLKEQNSFFKRSIKYEDVNLTLVLDFCCSDGGSWQRVCYEEAAEQTRGRSRSVRSSTSSYQGEDMGGTASQTRSGAQTGAEQPRTSAAGLGN